MSSSRLVLAALAVSVLVAAGGVGSPAHAGEAYLVELRKLAVGTFLDRCESGADFADRTRNEAFWNQLYSLGYTPAQILEATEAIGADCEFISIKNAVMQLAAQLELERGARPTEPAPAVSAVDDGPLPFARLVFDVEPPDEEAPAAQDEASAAASGEAASASDAVETPPAPRKVYPSIIDQFIEECPHPGEGAREQAQNEYDEMLASGDYTEQRLATLFELMPDNCIYVSFTTAVRSLAYSQQRAINAGRDAQRDSRIASSRRQRDFNETLMWTSNHPGRIFGFGLNFGLGVGTDITVNATPDEKYPGTHFDVELPGFELRIFPADNFSIDLLWQIGDMAWLNDKGIRERLLGITIFFHLHGRQMSMGPNTSVGFALAPYIFLFGEEGPGYSTSAFSRSSSGKGIGLGTRVGTDIVGDDGVFAFGLYLRPGFAVLNFSEEISSSPGVSVTPLDDGFNGTFTSAELLLEINLSVNIPRP